MREVRLSRVFLAGAREDVRVDVHIERRVVKLAPPPYFLVFGRELPNRCVVGLTVFFCRKDGKEVRLSHVFLAGA